MGSKQSSCSFQVNQLLTGRTQLAFPNSGYPKLPESAVCFHPSTAPNMTKLVSGNKTLTINPN